MKYKNIEEKIANQYIEMLIDDINEFSFKDIVSKAKVKHEEANLIFPFDDNVNKINLMKIFLNNLDKHSLSIFIDTIKDEKVSFYEKLLEGIFIRFEQLFEYKKAIKKLSNNLNKKFLNFNILFFNNHIYMLKLLKLSGDDDNFIRLNIKSTMLNSIFIRLLFVFLNDEKIDLNSLMRKIDDELKKLFEIKIIFKNN